MQKHDWEDRNPSQVYGFHENGRAKAQQLTFSQKTEQNHKKNKLCGSKNCFELKKGQNQFSRL